MENELEIKITAMLAVARSVYRRPTAIRCGDRLNDIGYVRLFSINVRIVRTSVRSVDLRCPNCTFTSTHCVFVFIISKCTPTDAGTPTTDRPAGRSSEKGKMKNDVRDAFVFTRRSRRRHRRHSTVERKSTQTHALTVADIQSWSARHTTFSCESRRKIAFHAEFYRLFFFFSTSFTPYLHSSLRLALPETLTLCCRSACRR